jgi:TetR/AcrR family fatty acid metabolism transcriptional regulator
VAGKGGYYAMPKDEKDRKKNIKSTIKPVPRGKVKIAEALISLLEEKEFNAITTAQISRRSGVNEALIYKYFGDKRGLLHQVLGNYLEDYLKHLELELKGIKGTLNKLRRLIWSHLSLYNSNRVLTQILLLDVRSCPGYFESESYAQVRRYSKVLMKILDEGVRKGELRGDIPTAIMRQVILGGIEHMCLPKIIYRKRYSPEDITKDLFETVLGGIGCQNAKNKKAKL